MEHDHNPQTEHEKFVTEAWRTYLTTGMALKGEHQVWFERPFFRPIFRALPADPRCQICYIPFKGIGGFIAKRMLDVVPSQMNPHLCNLCERFAEKYLGGVEMEISVLFADIRGSTPLAEKMSTSEYSALIRRFYSEATKPLYAHYAFIEKFIGDGMTAFFVPAFAGPNHAKSAIEAGKGILRAMGNGRGKDAWLPVGLGVHTGNAYIGSMKMEGGRTDIAILGDTVNTAARLCSQAQAGEMLVSGDAAIASGLLFDGREQRTLTLKGKEKPVDAWVIKT